MKTKTLLLGAIFSILSGNLFSQIKVMNSGRVAMGTNTIDSIYKVSMTEPVTVH